MAVHQIQGPFVGDSNFFPGAVKTKKCEVLAKERGMCTATGRNGRDRAVEERAAEIAPLRILTW